jgi:glycosyltransferase involved in cell wall biosynthesis
MRPTVSVVIASYNAGLFLGRALTSLSASTTPPLEVIVVDDCSTDGSAAPSLTPTATVIRTSVNGGPARARNLGAQSARGEILFFMDSDVCMHPDTLERVYQEFERNNSPDAVIGAYDDAPAARNFLSQYRNLMHCFVHRTGSREAFTFWSGCGAIRRDVFVQFGGFDERYKRPSIEDIELGYRLVAGGRRIMLCPAIQVKHLKRWTIWQMIKTDVFDRGIPWAELILREGRMPNDLNLQVSQRLSVILVYLLIGLSAVGHFLYSGSVVLVMIIMLNLRFYSFLANRRGYHFAAAAIPFHLLYHFYNGLSFGIGLIRWRATNGRP